MLFPLFPYSKEGGSQTAQVEKGRNGGCEGREKTVLPQEIRAQEVGVGREIQGTQGKGQIEKIHGEKKKAQRGKTEKGPARVKYTLFCPCPVSLVNGHCHPTVSPKLYIHSSRRYVFLLFPDVPS